MRAPSLDTTTTKTTPRRVLATSLCAFGMLATGVAVAQGAVGGTAAPGEPEVLDASCLSKCIKPHKGVVGSRFRVTGTDLQDVTVVSLQRADGTRAKDMTPMVKPSGAVLAYVKKGAITGTVRIRDSYGQIADSEVEFKVGTLEQLARAQSGWKFPIRAAHDYGSSMSRFGAPRSGHTHQGQDVSAACGSKLVAARGGKVQYSGYQADGAGNYIVIDGYRDKFDYVYMHLASPSPARTGQTVSTGQRIGEVGATGAASGCHLHFEKWTPTGWYEGGHPVDPLSTLKYWDSFS